MNKNKLVQYFIISTFVSLYLIVSVISTIHVIDFFLLSNPKWLAISLAIAFEIGAAASLASLIVLNKMNKVLVWALFIVLTLMQMMGNAFYAYTHLSNYTQWIELFGLVEEDPITQKRILAIISGSILPLIALGFIKSLVDYIKPEPNENSNADEQKEINPSESYSVKQVEYENDVELERASLEDFKLFEEEEEQEHEMSEEEYREFIASPEGQELLKEIIAEQNQIDVSVENSSETEIENNSEESAQKELTPEDIERYKEMTKIKVGQSQRKKPLNPQILPGLNM
ncbi:hypothetical protein EBU94_00245 [bacterium]|nr:hypothetical protein [bacterium]